MQEQHCSLDPALLTKGDITIQSTLIFYLSHFKGISAKVKNFIALESLWTTFLMPVSTCRYITRHWFSVCDVISQGFNCARLRFLCGKWLRHVICFPCGIINYWSNKVSYTCQYRVLERLYIIFSNSVNFWKTQVYNDQPFFTPCHKFFGSNEHNPPKFYVRVFYKLFNLWVYWLLGQ